jgi:uncharacterized protein (TIGR02246 family)
VIGLLALPGFAEQPKGDPKDMEAIAKNGEAFIEAFHKGDAKALAAFWTEDGDFTDQTGRHVKGRAALEKAFQQMFSENEGLKLHTESDSLRFVTPDVAIEDGTTEVIPADGGPPTKARYTIVHVKKDGMWLLSSVRNSPFAPLSNYQHLRGLEWIIGEWAGESGKGEGERLSFTWDEHQNFILGTFSTTARDVPVTSATQWIGWDPGAKRIRSWIFDVSGAFGEGSWTAEGKKWVVKTTLVLQGGKKAAATFILSPVDADTIALQSKDRSVDGEKLPDTKEMKLKRVK